MNAFSSDQWPQQNPNAVMTHSGGNPSDNKAIQDHKDSTQETIGQVGPKAIRRRSRASRRTPATVLNASPTDFRALVQRFTGCESSSTSVSVLVSNLRKGPLNIDFERKDMSGSSSRPYTYFDNEMRTPLQSVQMQSVEAGYGMENPYGVYESINDSTLLATPRDGVNNEYHG